MRIDKFLNAVNITKRRAVAEDMLEHKVVFINDQAVKKAKEVKVGDIIIVHRDERIIIDRETKYEKIDKGGKYQPCLCFPDPFNVKVEEKVNQYRS